MRKTAQIILLLSMIMVAFSACKKNQETTPKSTRLLNGTASMDKYLKIWDNSRPIRNTNPYSLAAIREVKAILSGFEKPEIVAIGNKPLENDNLQYYCRINLNNANSNAALKTWLESDSTRSVFDFPMDSVSMYPELFQERGMKNSFYQSTYAYTTVWANDPLPSNIDFNIIDTLYIPNSTNNADDWFLDIMAHILTANISPNSMRVMDAFDNSIVDNIGRIYNVTLLSGNSNAIKQFNNPGDIVGMPDLYEIGDRLYDVWEIRDYGTNNRTDGRITFRENQLNVWEGIKNIRIKIVHFTFLTHTAHMYNTDELGNFNLPWFLPGTGTMVFEFANSKVKVIDADLRNAATTVWTSLNLPYAARDIEWYWYTQPGDTGVRYAHGSKSALWGMIMNGVQEANKYTLDEGMRGSQAANPHLTVYAAYRDNEWNAGGSAPMFSHTMLNAINMNYLSWLFGIAGATAPGTGNSPDMIICQSVNNNYNSRQLRHTIYHEYGHSLQYFKVGATIWTDNVINSMATPQYGERIDSFPGNMFALTEGWADYVGHSFAFKRYGTGATRSEWNVWTLSMVTGHYQSLLEEVPTYSNNFIPRGLFYDLTDADRIEENNFDLINGFTMNDIYQTFRAGQNTIQKFRNKWDEEHPSVNNNLLFVRYNVQ